MSPELDAALCKDFPLLFKDRNAPMTHTAMCWGFPGDGWEPLIRRLAEKLERIIQAGIDDGTWTVNDYTNLHPCATQVKEKYGGLRFYMTSYTDEIADLIEQAEEESYRICERCTAPGSPNKRGWIMTLCDTCREKYTKI